MQTIERRHHYSLEVYQEENSGKTKLHLEFALEKIPFGTVLLKEKGCLSAIKTFFLTLFNWKWIRLKDSDVIINVNSLANKLEIQHSAVRALAQSGKKALFDAVFKKQFAACPSYEALIGKAEEQFQNDARKDEVIKDIKDLLDGNGYRELPGHFIYIRPRPAFINPKGEDWMAVDKEATAKMHELFKKVDSFIHRPDFKFAVCKEA